MTQYVLRVPANGKMAPAARVRERDRVLGELKTSLGDAFNIVSAEKVSVMALVECTPGVRSDIEQKYPTVKVSELSTVSLPAPPQYGIKK